MSFHRTVLSLLMAFCLPAPSLFSQTLFTYGKEKISSEEFLKAFNKNNSEAKNNEQAYRDYLELYARFKLKVQAAYDARLDTLDNQRTELLSFRNQLAENYLKNDSIIEKLVEEAFRRSLKDIRLADIFILLNINAPEETIKAAETKINEAYEALLKGTDFGTVAQKYNKESGSFSGELGYVSVFTLPYELETAAWSLQPGTYSRPFRGMNGFHIIKNRGERKAAGKLRIAQILLAFKPFFTPADTRNLASRADSIYKALKSGADFSAFAARFSDDSYTYNTGGELPAFEPGRYDPVFEDAAFGLASDSDISAPVATSFGYHIIKRIQRIPVIEDSTNADWKEVLKERVLQSDRMQFAQQKQLRKIQSLINFKKGTFDAKHFSIITDSLYQGRNLPDFQDLNNATPLFTVGKETKTLIDFLNYYDGIRGMNNLIEGKTGSDLFDQYAEMASMEYYRNHLEDYHPEFAAQISEFTQGNLLFEIMQKKVWDAAVADSLGLLDYYSGRKDKYWWELSADAVLLTCAGSQTAAKLRSEMETDPLSWKSPVNAGNGNIQADSGRFELSQIPIVERTNFTPGLLTAPVKNEQDSSITFAYIIRLYKEREPKKFEDARGTVINDYQNYLEEKWIADLKKKYPVRIQKKAFSRLPKP